MGKDEREGSECLGDQRAREQWERSQASKERSAASASGTTRK
jgi:hypothetical protein